VRQLGGSFKRQNVAQNFSVLIEKALITEKTGLKHCSVHQTEIQNFSILPLTDFESSSLTRTFPRGGFPNFSQEKITPIYLEKFLATLFLTVFPFKEDSLLCRSS